MESTFVTEMNIVNVRHLHNIKIPISRSHRRHLILTGKNGSGKTSVLKELSAFLQYVVSDEFQVDDSKERVAEWKDKLSDLSEKQRGEAHQHIRMIECNARHRWNDGCVVTINSPLSMREKYRKGQFILAYYQDDRKLDIESYTNVSKIELKHVYEIDEQPSKSITRYMANLKVTQAFAKLKGDQERDKEIQMWFDNFEQVLRDIYDDQTLELRFDDDTYQFTVHLLEREPFALNCMSMGYAVIFDIVGDMMMRMGDHHAFDLEGVVLIDEVETHLHVELQKAIVPILTKLFPNIQFVLTTHSPFILNSTPDSVVYDLENRSYVEGGLTNLSYKGIVESYFHADRYIKDYQNRYQEFCELLGKRNRTDEENAELAEHRFYLDRMPEFLAVDFRTEYAEKKRNMNL